MCGFSIRMLSSCFVIRFKFDFFLSYFVIFFGGLGIRRISDICLPAFLSSIHGVKKLVSLLLNSKDNELIMMKL
jgi:hypothetical protein